MKISKPYKSRFPYPVNFWCRIDFDPKANAIVLLERHTFFWWKWTKHLFPVETPPAKPHPIIDV